MRKIIALFILTITICSCNNNSMFKLSSSHEELQTLVDSMKAEMKNEVPVNKSESYDIYIDNDTLWMCAEFMGEGDKDRVSAAINDKDVRRMTIGRMIAMLYIFEPSEKETQKDIDTKRIIDLVVGEKMNLGFKFVSIYGTIKDNLTPDEIITLRDKYLPIAQKEEEERKEFMKHLNKTLKRH